MKRTIALLSIFCVSITLIYAQTFVEISEYGWGQSMSYSKPSFVDIDNDGLLDMIVGEFDGNLYHYEQDSLSSDNFVLITENFNGIDVGSSPNPYFIDIDNDSLLDMIIGEKNGNLNHYEQHSSGSYNFVLITENFNGIDVGLYSAPCFVDIDNDGLLDMIVGEQDGNLNHYKQNSSGSYNFVLITENFNGINVGGRSAPCFIDIDNDGLLDLIVGEDYSFLNHYEQVSSGSCNFVLITAYFNGIVVYLSAPCFVDIDADGLLDMIIGEYDGNLNHYKQESLGSYNFVLITENFNGIDVGYKSAHYFIDIDNNGLLDMIVGEKNGNLNHFEQESSGSYNFVLITENFNGIDVGWYAAPCFEDIDNDGLLDMIIGEWDGNLNHYEQNSSDSYSFTLISENFNGINVGSFSAPCFEDVDNDGMLDMIVGEDDGNLNHYEQNSSYSYNFVSITENFNGIDVGNNSAPCFVDIDNDGLLDLFVGESDGNIHHYELESSGSYNFVSITANFNGIDVGNNSVPCFADIDNDGLLDLFVGESDGGIYFFRQVVIPDFTANPRFGYSSLNVSFSNQTIGDPTNIYWDFENDGIYDSIELNPTHIYPESGIYSVKLKVEKAAFQDYLIKTNYIIVQALELTAPQNLLINENNNNIILQWDIVTNADYYLVYKSTDTYGDFEFLDHTTGNVNTTYTHTGVTLDEDKMFYFVIGFDGTLRELLDFIENNRIKQYRNFLK
ncbi:MAG: FG-GAP-like repeat-containing protein [Candidatus Cloacimonetes bacterium]|nr:FG-GAP-like repeat-containing protein [Candidatus Cloacimonadota bacterium]